MKKAIIILTAVFTALAVLTSCGKNKAQYTEYVTDANGEYVTDKDGNIETTVIDDENVSVEYVTDKDGKKTIDENGEYVTVLHMLRDVTVTDANGKVVTSKQEVANTTASIDDMESYTSVEAETTVSVGEATKTSERLFETKVLSILKSGVFTMKMTFTGNLEGTGNVAMPAVLAYDTPNNRFYMETSLGVIKLKCIVKDGKMYLVMPSIKSYSVSDYTDEDGEMGDMMKEMTESISSSNAKYVCTTETKYNNVDCICEEYKEDNLTYRYFFQKNDQKFVRMELIDGDSGETTVVNIDTLVPGILDSYYQVPSGYQQIDLETIASALGS
ncbi:MAG: hypothetical protein IJU39_06550 [Clostridia bacterium]|nr:hypothetical protein [Clostridia bacterium]